MGGVGAAAGVDRWRRKKSRRAGYEGEAAGDDAAEVGEAHTFWTRMLPLLRAEGKEHKPVQKWNHIDVKVVDVSKLQESLNHWGDDGWELVTVVHERDEKTGQSGTHESWRLFFKRPK